MEFRTNIGWLKDDDYDNYKNPIPILTISRAFTMDTVR